jgi:hypothetical protein
MDVAPLPYLAVVTAAGSMAYLLVLRAGFAGTWRTLVSFLSHLVPQRARRRRPDRAQAEVLADGEVARA